MDERVERILSLLRELEWGLARLQQETCSRKGREGTGRESFPERVSHLLDEIRQDEVVRIREALHQLEPALQHARLGRVAGELAELYFRRPRSADFLDAALDLLIKETRSERAAIVLCQGKGVVEVVAARNFQSRNLEADEYALSRSVLNRALSKAEVVLLSDAQADPTYSQETSIIRRRVRSVLVAPFRIGTVTLGAIYLENNSVAALYTAEDREFFRGLGQIMAVFLDASDRLQSALQARDELSHTILTDPQNNEIIGVSPHITMIRRLIAQVAPSSETVLIEGESGTGKELVARALHAQSPRRLKPFVSVNCATIAEELAESELFGHERGAFTHAIERRIGRFELADGGTLFLDEVGELPLSVQAKLLRVLETREFERLGGMKTISVDVRVIAATSRVLTEMVSQGKFLDALYFRLNVVPIRLRPLRERREDIPLLAEHFLNKFAAEVGRPGIRFHPDALAALQQYSFPGNVRELINLIKRQVLLTPGDEIHLYDLPEEITGRPRPIFLLEKDPFRHILRAPLRHKADLEERRAEIYRIAQRYVSFLEQELIKSALERTGGNIAEAARLTGLHRSFFYRKMPAARDHSPPPDGSSQMNSQ
ncbi:MAG TPA: sigma-54-dependent Fis family transcriptional regulator [Blastocatellia bacterium]|nr:sigma-54-dependent Fis family transcriptional regulator [Blastocatellia bacterium]